MTEPSPTSDMETILLVDDDRSFCGALAGALRRRGFRVVVAHDHDDAMAEAEAWSPARAVVDGVRAWLHRWGDQPGQQNAGCRRTALSSPERR